MKTWHPRWGRNMFRIDFGLYMLENIEELLLSVLLRAWAWACVRSLYSCIHNSILVYISLFLRSCILGFWPVYARSYLRIWALTRIHEASSKGPTLPIFTYFSTISLLYAILIPLFVIFVSKHHYILLFIFILALKMLFFINSTWIKNLMSPFLFSFSFLHRSLCPGGATIDSRHPCWKLFNWFTDAPKLHKEENDTRINKQRENWGLAYEA